MKNKTLIILAFFSLVGCSTFSRKDCETMDWQLKGYQTAKEGQSPGEGVKYFARECGEYKVTVNPEAFKKGYDLGLQEFCTPENVRKFATDGGTYKGICPEKNMTVGFLHQYQTGREEYLLKKISSLESEVSSLEVKIRSQESEISSLKSKSCD